MSNSNARYSPMPNIRTLSDYNDTVSTSSRPNTQSFPNAWSGASNDNYNNNTYVTSPDQYPQQQQQQIQQPDDVFWSWNVEGQPKWYHIILNAFCPCFVGNPCSPVRRKDYIRLLLTFILWISVIQIIYFIVEVSVGGFASPQVNGMLGPPTKTLIDLGAKWTPYIKHLGHVHRLIVPIFMHAGVIHLAMNMWVQLMVGLGYERSWTILRIVPIYLLSGIGGNLLSACVSPGKVSVGASGAILGLIGAKGANIICRWPKLTPQMKIFHAVNMGFMIMFTFFLSFGQFVDWAGHLGGIFIGLLVGFIVFANEWENKIVRVVTALVASILIVAYTVITCCMIWLVVVAPL